MSKGKTIKAMSFGLYKPLQRLFNKGKKPSQPYITYVEKRPKKYLVIGGFIRSMNDKGEHYIPAITLVDLYNVRLEECILVHDVFSIGFKRFKDNGDLVWLMPRSSGNYIVPKKDLKDQLIKMGYRNEEWD